MGSGPPLLSQTPAVTTAMAGQSAGVGHSSSFLPKEYTIFYFVGCQQIREGAPYIINHPVNMLRIHESGVETVVTLLRSTLFQPASTN